MAKYLGSQKVAAYLGANLIDALIDGGRLLLPLSMGREKPVATTDGWGNVWVSSAELPFGSRVMQVDCFNPYTFERTTYYFESEHLSFREMCACTDSSGVVWFIYGIGGSLEEAINTFTPGGVQTAYGSVCPMRCLGRACVTDDFGRVWVGGGVDTIQAGFPHNDEFAIVDVYSSPAERIEYRLSGEIPYPAAVKDGNGHIWFGGKNHSVNENEVCFAQAEVFDPVTGGSRIYHFSERAISSTLVWRFAATCDRLGNVWFFCDRLADIFTPDGKRSNVSLSEEMMRPCATVDGNGDIWVAYDDTINIFNPLSHARIEKSLYGTVVTWPYEGRSQVFSRYPAAATDGRGNVWIFSGIYAHVFLAGGRC